MPLINCPDCTTEVSDKAPVCPKCGRPLSAQKSLFTKDLGVGGLIYTLIIGFGLLLVIANISKTGGFLLIVSGGILLFLRTKIWTGSDRK